jgi:hypothetical protein
MPSYFQITFFASQGGLRRAPLRSGFFLRLKKAEKKS